MIKNLFCVSPFEKMINKNALARYKLIDQRLNNNQLAHPTLEDLVQYIENHMNITVSVSSVQKDIYTMRYNEHLAYFAPINYDRNNKCYNYSEEGYSINQIPISQDELKDLELTLKILNQFKDIPGINIFKEVISKIAQQSKIINKENDRADVFILDRPDVLYGIEFVPIVVQAIREKKEMILKYKAFGKEEKKHTIHPYFIKEYKGRLYLLAKDLHPTKQSKVLAFAFDRIQDAIKMRTSYLEQKIDHEMHFHSTIGISHHGAKPEKIVLAFQPKQAQYLRSQVIHHSQKELKANKKEFVIELNLVINYELLEKIKGYGAEVKVLLPKKLADEMKNEAEKILALYK